MNRHTPYITVTCPVCHSCRRIQEKSLPKLLTQEVPYRCHPCSQKAKVVQPKATACRRCGCTSVTRPRGLCWTCYYLPGVREQFPSESKFATRQLPDRTGPAPLPQPTLALPGTPAKLAVMAARASRGEAIFHPDDARRDDLGISDTILTGFGL